MKKGEKLIREVRILIDHYGTALEAALTQGMGNQAQAKQFIDQLDALARALDVELYRKPGKPGAMAMLGIAVAVGSVLPTVATTVASEATKDMYDAVTDAKTASDEVVEECVLVVPYPGWWGEAPYLSSTGRDVLDEPGTGAGEPVDTTGRLSEPRTGGSEDGRAEGMNEPPGG
jgi:hypothetical protein